MKNKTLGSTLIIAGTSLGAGMIAMPLATAAIGIKFTLILMAVVWFLAVWSGLMVAELCRMTSGAYSLHGIAGNILGKPGQLIAGVCTICLPYALCAAYIAGATGHLSGGLSYWLSIEMSDSASALLITALFAGVILLSTSAVDAVNRILFIVKIIMLALLLVLLMRHIKIENLLSSGEETVSIWFALPLFFTSFGFQGTVPSVVRYVNGDPGKYRPAILIGSVIPFCVYLIWLLSTGGVLSQHEIITMDASDSVSAFTIAISEATGSVWVTTALNIFAALALATSFLGVALGLFEYLLELLSQKDTFAGRLKTILVTFIPPLIVALLFPQSFIAALGLASVILVIMAVFLPAAMLWILRDQVSANNQSLFLQFPLLVFAVFLGFLIVVSQLAVMIS